MDRRVVITGMGGIAPNGNNPKEIFWAVVNGQSGIREVTTFPLDSHHLCRVAGEVDFHIGWVDRLLRKDLSKIARATQFAMYTIKQALADSHLRFDHLTPEKAQRVGICMGASLIGMTDIIKEINRYQKSGAKWISAALIQKIMPNAAVARPSMQEGIHGPTFTIAAACASSGMAIIDAHNMIASGECDIVINGGCEDPTDPISLASFGNLTALSTNWNDQPKKALRPFDSKRDGFVPAEGGVAFVFEELSHALARNAPIYAEVAGCARNSDAYNIVHPEPEGFWQSLCMKTALERAGVQTSQLSYINAHGTGTPEGDPAECKAIASCLGKEAERVPVSSTKGATGHLMSASAAVEFLICVMAINEGVIPPTTNLDIIDSECTGVRHVQKRIKTNVEIALSNSFGFGGENAVSVVRRFVP